MLSNPLAFSKTLCWLKLSAQLLRAGEQCCTRCLVGSAENLHLTACSGGLLSASQSRIHATAAAKSREYPSTGILRERGELQGFLQNPENVFLGEQRCSFACRLATGGLRVPCIAVTAGCAHAWLLQPLVFKQRPEVLCFLWEVTAPLS